MASVGENRMSWLMIRRAVTIGVATCLVGVGCEVVAAAATTAPDEAVTGQLPPVVESPRSPPELPAVSKGSTIAPVGASEPMAPIEVDKAERFVAPKKASTPKRVRELPGLAKENSKTFLNDDGSKTDEISQDRINYRSKDGTYLPIDTRIVEGSDGVLSNAADSWRYEFRAVGSGGVSVTTEHASTFSFAPSGGSKDVAPVLTGESTVTYRSVWPGVDLRYTVTANGLKEEMVLSGPLVGGRHDLVLKGARLDVAKATETAAEHPVAVTDSGEVVGLSSVTVFDAKGTEFTAEATKAALSADRSAGDGVLSVGVDDGWLASLPADAFPVVVDPTTVTQGAVSWVRFSKNGTGQCDSTVAGCYPGVGNVLSNVARGYVQFPLAGYAVHSILAATLNISPTTTPAWGSTISVYDAPCWYYNCLSDWGGVEASTSINGAIGLDLTSWVQWRLSLAQPAPWGFNPVLGFLGAEFAPGSYFAFGATFTITYSDGPVPTATSPANFASAHSKTPVLSVTASDADGDNFQPNFIMCGDPGWPDGRCAGSGWQSWVTSGSNYAYTVPAGWISAWNQPKWWWVQLEDPTGTGAGNLYGPFQYTASNSPPTTPSPVAPADNSVSLTATPSFTSGTATDPDGSAVTYRFVVATGEDGQTGRIVDSGLVASPSWTPAANQVPDGVFFWSVQACDVDLACSAWSKPARFRQDRRLGVRSSLPFDSAGPLAVNLASGNLVASIGGPSYSTVDGAAGVSFTYNSQQVTPRGLTGSVFDDPNADGLYQSGEAKRLERVDPQVNFNWGVPGTGPAPGAVKPDRFTASWSGQFTTPTAGTYQFRSVIDAKNQTSVQVGAATASGLGSQTTAGVAVTAFSPLSVNVTFGMRTGAESRIAFQYSMNAGATWADVPADMLTPTDQVLPDGWASTGPSLGTAGYTRLSAGESQVTVVDASGANHVYTSLGAGFSPPPEEDGNLSRLADGSWQLTAEDGYTYSFDVNGRLTKVLSPSDVLHPGAIQYTYGTYGAGTGIRLLGLTDAVGRTVQLVYGNGTTACQAGSNAPDGMLCQVRYTDFKRLPTDAVPTTDLTYSSGHLARLTNPGAVATDFAYDGPGRIVGIRDGATNDLVVAGKFSSGSTVDAHFWSVAYDASNRVLTVKAPQASATAAQAQRDYDWTSAPTTTRVKTAGVLNPSGWTRQVTLDSVGRVTQDTDITGVSTNTEWSTAIPPVGQPVLDRVLRTVDHHYRADPTNGLVSTAVYDAANRPTDSYGPGTVAELGGIGSTMTPAGTAPRSQTKYDENITGLAGTWWTNDSEKTGPPALYTTSSGQESWGSGAPSNSGPFPGATVSSDRFSGQLSGQVTLPSAQQVGVNADGARLFVDDVKVADSWGGPYRNAVLLDHPVSSWRLGETTGTTATDSVSGRNGTTTGVTWTAAGVLDQGQAQDADTAATFNGTSKVTIAPPPAGAADPLNIPGDVTIEAWIKPTTTTGFQSIANRSAASGDAISYDLRLNGSTLEFVQRASSDSASISSVGSSNAVVANSWNHVVGTRITTSSGTVLRVYVNGVETSGAQGQGAPSLPTDNTYIGNRYFNGSSVEPFTGVIDEVSIYATGMSNARVQAHYTARGGAIASTGSTGGYSRAVAEDGPSTWYRFPTSSSATAPVDGSTAGADTGAGGSGLLTLLSPGAIAGEAGDSALVVNSNGGFRAPAGAVFAKSETVEAWFKTSSAGIIAGMSNSVGGAAPTHYTPALYVDAAGLLRGGFWTVTGLPGMASSSSVADNNWHHVALTASVTSQEMYLDGVRVASSNVPIDNWDMADIQFGSGYWGGWPGASGTGGNFPGSIDEVAIYPYPLSADRVAAHVKARNLATVATGTHRLRVDYQELNGNASMSLWETASGTNIPAAQLSPRYGLVTSTVDPDGYQTKFEYQYPELGLQTAQVQDPAGAALRTEMVYEPAGTGGFRRLIQKRLPAVAAAAGTGIVYDYYAQSGSTNFATNTCPTGGTNINQGGALRKKTSVDPDGAGALAAQTEEYVYFGDGLLAASRKNSEANWTCFTYDNRGRLLTKAVPAFGTAVARTVTYSYAVSGDPTVLKISDNSTSTVVTNPAITTTTDWIGRTLSYTDALGRVTTTTYDDPSGRVASLVGPGTYGTLTQTWDTFWRPVSTKIGGNIIATVSYDTASGVSTGVTYPAGTGNGATLALSQDTRGRLAQMMWTGPGATALTSDTVTRTAAGRVLDESFDGTIGGTGDANTAGVNYAYDGAGRLYDAYVPGHRYTYSYGPPTAGDCPTGSLNANRNSNRTSVTDQPLPTGTAVVSKLCYGPADRLISTTISGVGSSVAYDTRGRATQLATDQYGYDSSDRHVSTTTSTPGTVSLVGTTKVQVAAGVSTVTVPKPAGLALGDLIVVSLNHDGANAPTAASGFTAMTNVYSAGSTTPNLELDVYWKVAVAADVSGSGWSFTLAGTTTTTSAGVGVVVRGADTSGAGVPPFTDGPEDVSWSSGGWGTATRTNGSTNIYFPPVTTLQANDVAFTIVGSNAGAVTFTADSGYTENLDSGYASGRNFEVASKGPIAAGVTPNPTITSSAATALSGVHFTVKAAPSAGTTVTYVRDPGDRIIARLLNGTPTGCYSFTGDSDTPDQTLSASGTACSATVVETTYGMPGGATVTKRGTTATDVWSLPNIHGDIAAVTNGSGVKQGATLLYSPDGTALAGLPDNSAGNFDNGWEGSHQKALEHEAGLLQTIEMGARPYNPAIGRFLTIDPIEGGTPNDYIYPFDSINQSDLTGTWWSWKDIKKAVKSVAKKVVKIAKKAAPYVAAAGFVACTFATAGACGVIGAIGVGVSAVQNLGGCVVDGCTGRQWIGAAVRVGVDVALSRVGTLKGEIAGSQFAQASRALPGVLSGPLRGAAAMARADRSGALRGAATWGIAQGWSMLSAF